MDFSRPALSGGRNLADGYHVNISCLPLPRLTVRHGRPHWSCVLFLLLWLGLCSSVLSHLIPWSIPVWPSLLCSDKTLSFALLSAIFIPSRVCHRVLTVRSCLSFPLQKQVMVQQENVPPQFEDQLLVIKGITTVTRQFPRPWFSSPSLISKAFKHMFACGLIIIAHRLSTAMLFCHWFTDP